jgi:hypothetical protein
METEHEVVVEIYDGIALSMKCVPCRVRLPIRPERSASRLVDLNEMAREHAAEARRDAEAALDRVRREVANWPPADFWHRDAILRAIAGERS